MSTSDAVHVVRNTFRFTASGSYVTMIEPLRFCETGTKADFKAAVLNNIVITPCKDCAHVFIPPADYFAIRTCPQCAACYIYAQYIPLIIDSLDSIAIHAQ